MTDSRVISASLMLDQRSILHQIDATIESDMAAEGTKRDCHSDLRQLCPLMKATPVVAAIKMLRSEIISN